MTSLSKNALQDFECCGDTDFNFHSYPIKNRKLREMSSDLHTVYAKMRDDNALSLTSICDQVVNDH